MWQIALLRLCQIPHGGSAAGRLSISALQKSEEPAVVLNVNTVPNDVKDNMALFTYCCQCVRTQVQIALHLREFPMILDLPYRQDYVHG